MLNKWLPYFIYKRLFGDRRRFGLNIDESDPDFRMWRENYLTFYHDNQKGFVGSVVNRWGFRVVSRLDFTGKKVLELGPGVIEHTQFMKARPSAYCLADIDPRFLELSAEILEKQGFQGVETLWVGADKTMIPKETGWADIVLTFHQLEHVHDLERHLDEIWRVLKPGGVLAGSVPVEGGLAWGAGRFFTSRRYVKKHMPFNYDKIICWEHPNFVDKILALLRRRFVMENVIWKPFPFLPADFNLSCAFVCRRLVGEHDVCSGRMSTEISQ